MPLPLPLTPYPLPLQLTRTLISRDILLPPFTREVLNVAFLLPPLIRTLLSREVLLPPFTCALLNGAFSLPPLTHRGNLTLMHRSAMNIVKFCSLVCEMSSYGHETNCGVTPGNWLTISFKKFLFLKKVLLTLLYLSHLNNNININIKKD